MTMVASTINGVFTFVFDIICWPFQALEPIWAMTAISLLVGVLMVWIFGKISDQEAIKLIRDRIRGNLIGVRLFQHDVRIVLDLQATITRDTLRFMKHALGPMVLLLVPLLFVMIQLHLRFSVRPLQPGEPAVVTGSRAGCRGHSERAPPRAIHGVDGRNATRAHSVPTRSGLADQGSGGRIAPSHGPHRRRFSGDAADCR